MDINLKSTLKNLRQRKNVTQEALAGYLGISQQSVGKWERGEGFPDIVLLPKLALYFGVTIDDLLDVGQARIDEKIEEYEQQGSHYMHVGDIDASIALWEKAYQEFPNDIRVMKGYMNTLSSRGLWPPHKEDADRIIELGTRILKESTDTSVRESAIQCLCYTYDGLGDTENALLYADMGGGLYCCRANLRSHVLKGEKGIEEAQCFILNLLREASMTAVTATIKDGLTAKEKIHYIQFSIDLIKMLFSDGNVGFCSFDLSFKLSYLAQQYAEIKDTVNTLNTLEECVKYCVLDAQKTDCSYTAPLINRLTFKENTSTKNFKGNACNVRLQEFTSPFFDFVRADPRFKKMEDTLKQYAE